MDSSIKWSPSPKPSVSRIIKQRLYLNQSTTSQNFQIFKDLPPPKGSLPRIEMSNRKSYDIFDTNKTSTNADSRNSRLKITNYDNFDSRQRSFNGSLLLNKHDLNKTQYSPSTRRSNVQIKIDKMVESTKMKGLSNMELDRKFIFSQSNFAP